MAVPCCYHSHGILYRSVGWPVSIFGFTWAIFGHEAWDGTICNQWWHQPINEWIWRFRLFHILDVLRIVRFACLGFATRGRRQPRCRPNGFVQGLARVRDEPSPLGEAVGNGVALERPTNTYRDARSFRHQDKDFRR